MHLLVKSLCTFQPSYVAWKGPLSPAISAAILRTPCAQQLLFLLAFTNLPPDILKRHGLSQLPARRFNQQRRSQHRGLKTLEKSR